MILWNDIDKTVLKALKNPARGYEQYIDIPEFTFLGVNKQPDFGHIKMWFYGKDSTIELKSLKEYIFEYRDAIISYERCIDVLFKDLLEVYKPDRIRIEITFMPRGGISSTLKADSDWGHFGGTDELWKHHK